MLRTFKLFNAVLDCRKVSGSTAKNSVLSTCRRLNLGGQGDAGNTTIIEQLIREHTSVIQRKKMNAALAATLRKNAKHSLDRRLTLESSLDDMITFSRADLIAGLKQIPQMTADEGDLG